MNILDELRAKNNTPREEPQQTRVLVTHDQLTALIAAWTQHNRNRNLAERSVWLFSDSVSKLAHWLGSKPVTLYNLREYFQEAGKVFSHNTAHLHYTKTGYFFKWLREERVLDVNPMKFVSHPRSHRRPKKRPYTHDEYLALIANATFLRFRWMIVAAYNLGLRVGGLAWLKWKDVDMEQRRITTIEPKVKRLGIQSIIPFSPGGDVEQCLLQLKAEYDPNDDNWPGPGFVCRDLALLYSGHRASLSMEFWRTCKRAGVESLGLHSLRRAFCSVIANHSGLNAVAGMKMMGHRSFQTYQGYVTVDGEVLADGLIKAFAKVGQKHVAMKQIREATK